MADRKLIPLGLLARADGGVVEGSTRLQKLVFLVQQESGPELPDDLRYDYFGYDYGPFSKELSDDLASMAERGWIAVEERPSANGTQYVYQLTEAGRRAVREMADEWTLSGAEVLMDRVTHVEDVFNHMPLSNLLEYVYNHYEGYTTESELDIS